MALVIFKQFTHPHFSEASTLTLNVSTSNNVYNFRPSYTQVGHRAQNDLYSISDGAGIPHRPPGFVNILPPGGKFELIMSAIEGNAQTTTPS